MNTAEHADRRRLHIVALAAIMTIAGISTSAALVLVERAHPAPTNWVVFAIFGTLLFLAETRPSFTMRFGDQGSISPGWTFAYALMLFGMGLEALAVLVVANIIAAIEERRPPRIGVLNIAVLATSLSTGALVLHAFGLHGSMTAAEEIPLPWGIAIVLGAASMLLVNGLVIALAIKLHTGVGILNTLRTGLALSMTADGALLSLAPVFVIAVDFSLALVPLLASTSLIVIRSARRSLHRAHQANHDPLTDLLNRRAFIDRLGQITGSTARRPAVVLVMDFDRFKDINDSLGHGVGDRLLCAFATRLTEELPTTASAARLGGDEFSVVIPDTVADADGRQRIAELHRALTASYDIDGFPLTMGVSIGVCVAPDHGRTPDDLIAAADLAMYRAKQGAGGVEWFEMAPAQQELARTGIGRVGLLSGLAAAIEGGQLVNVYQPQIDTITGDIDTLEALVRWRHPEHGLVMPGEFVDMAEQTDLIDALTFDVLQRALGDVLRLSDDTVSIAVNVSARSLHDRSFANDVIALCETFGFPPERLELEITERAIGIDPDRIRLTTARLRDVGIRLAIDDFGTGYNSFASLRQIRADRLKIDRSFTKRLETSADDQLVVRTIVELGHGLGLNVVAEGVESPQILEQVRLLGCDFSQGYGIAMPGAIEEIQRMLDGGRLEREITA